MPGQRLFIAVDLSRAATDDLARLVGSLAVTRARARVAARERWHVTLVFLGDVPDERVDDARQAVAAAAATAQGPIDLRLAGGGRFGRRRFTILWAGVDGDVPALATLARTARRELKRRRLPYDPKPFRPHLTLARPGDRLPAAEIAADVATLAGYAGPTWTASEIVLIRSHLGPNPVHEPLLAARLGS